MDRLAILTVKDEGAFLLEWVAFHRSAGFTAILGFSNDCSDGTDAMLDRLAEMGLAIHERQAGPFAKGPQWTALNAAERHPALAAADWAMPIDIDEFLNIHAGDGTLDALFAADPRATAFALPWRLFGNGGVTGFEDRPVTAQFLRAAPPGMAWPWRAAMVKTLFRNDGSYARLGVHRPRQPRPDALPRQRWIAGSGRTLPPRFAQTGLFVPPAPDMYGLAQINHYALGAMESYVVKAARGRANREAAAHDMSYWVERNFDTEEDRSILPAAARAAPLLDELLADRVLGPLHRAAVAWRRQRFAALMAEEPWRALFGRLLLAPASRPLPPERMALLLAHARRAAETVAPDAAD
ncbi:glycosyltransferase family 2 protein [Frigidibacter oleivorans]|uniref:glycosyltransferase family 2 protein n=1 Tax=Frigidibacter oleivorans TaxID=2487129 RepID=UPI000F8E603A|nr:glycosyltransferase family 2 protein [Frigidibacter oleivorans]